MSSSSSLYKQLGLGAGSPVSASHLLLLVLGAGFLALTVFVVHPNEFRIQSFFSGRCGRPGTDAASAAVAASLAKNVTGGTRDAAATAAWAPDDVRVLIGIQTLPSKYERRNLLRTIYSLQAREQPSLAGSVDVRFVFCNVTSPVDAVLVSLEVIRHGDIIVLDCAENMDNGKTYTFFSTVARAFNTSDGEGSGSPAPPRYDYVMKADDDTYLRLPALVDSLRGAARRDAYYGLQMPCDRENFYPFPPFMSGMGYALSWDLVQWVATAEESRRDRVGPEDMWTGRWLNLAGKAKNRYDMAPRMYNYRGGSPPSCFRRDFAPDTIAVHMLKDAARWAETLRYFNATAALRPSHL